MDELGGALKELARQAQAPTPVDPAALWRQGRSRVRRRRIVIAATAVVLAVLGSLAVVRPEPRVVMPAGSPHAPAIPENIYRPNRFLAGVSKAGPPGRLAVIVPGSGDQGHRYGRWYGISATTGAYVALDLPGLATDSAMRLSPDGYRLAYWVTGPTRKKTFGPPTPSDAGGPLPDRPAAGVAVYDTRDGTVVKHPALTDFGLATDVVDVGLYWLDDDTLYVANGVRTGSNSANDFSAYLWTYRSGERRLVSTGLADDVALAPAGPGDRVTRGVNGRYTVVDPDLRPAGASVLVPVHETVPDAVSIWGDRVVKTGDDGGGFDRLLTGVLDPRGQVRLVTVGKLVYPHLLGWLSPARVLVSAFARAGNLDSTRGLYSVDLATQQVSRIGDVSSDLGDDSMQVATSLLGNALVHGRKPPSLVDVFRVPLVIGGVGLLAVTGWLVVRRRRRA